MSINNYDPVEFDKQWADALQRAAAGKGGITIGTLIHRAKLWGYSTATSTVAFVEPWVVEMNEEYAWIEAQTSIYRLKYGDFIEPAKLRTHFDNKTITVSTRSGDREINQGTMWLRNPDRRQHVKLVIRPDEGEVTHDNCLNEWHGFVISPARGNIKPFLKLLRWLVPDSKARRYVLFWLSHLARYPAIKMHVSLIFWSREQGVGKNLLFDCMTSIIGSRHATLIGQAELSSTFNGWAKRKVLVIGDEVSSSDRREDQNKLKGLITGTTGYINEKYQPAQEVPNLLNFIFLSNHNDALFLDDTDRRYFVWEITAGRLRIEEAQEFAQWRDNGGLAVLLDFLLKLNISTFNPKAPAPMTDAKLQMSQDNRSDLENWAAELMASNVSQIIGRELATASELARRYYHEAGHHQPSAKAIVGTFKKLGAYARTNQVRMPNGRKLRVLALTRPDYWAKQPEPDWATEMGKPLK